MRPIEALQQHEEESATQKHGSTGAVALYVVLKET